MPGPKSEASANRESVVSSFGAFVAFRHVGGETAGERQHLTLFAWYVCAEIPGVGAWEESAVCDLEHVRAPRFLRGARRLETRPIALANMVQHLSDPVALKLCASRPVRESVRAVRPVNEEQIRKASGGHSEMGAHALRPLFSQRFALRAPA